MRNDRVDPDDELARLFLDELESGHYDQDEMDDNELQVLRRPQQDSQYYG